MATSAEAVVMSRPGTRATPGQRAEQVRVDADRHDVHPCRVDAVVAVRCRAKLFSDTVMTRREPAGDPGLHPGEGVPAAQGEALARRWRRAPSRAGGRR